MKDFKNLDMGDFLSEEMFEKAIEECLQEDEHKMRPPNMGKVSLRKNQATAFYEGWEKRKP